MRSIIFWILFSISISQNVFAFDNCTIIARHSQDNVVTKYYSCKNAIISLSGESNSQTEFGSYFSGERLDFGILPGKITKSFHNCVESNKAANNGGCSNCDGYMTVRKPFNCTEGSIILHGYWGEEYQGHWSYNLDLGEVDMTPQWVDNPQELMHFTSSFQKWCPTKYGYKLCGWIEEPKVDHGVPPAFKR